MSSTFSGSIKNSEKIARDVCNRKNYIQLTLDLTRIVDTSQFAPISRSELYFDIMMRFH